MKQRHSDETVERQKERLAESSTIFPYPALIAFIMCVLLTGHIVTNLNPRLGNPADIVSFQGQKQQEGAIWFSVTPYFGRTVVTTFDRKVFSWDESSVDTDATLPFVEHLRYLVKEATLSAGLAKEAFASQAMAVVAVDQRLKYFHLRPVLYALADAGISHYAFETRRPLLAGQDESFEEVGEGH